MTASNAHSAQLMDYTIAGNTESTFTWTWGSKLPGTVTSIALRN
jgi:hypothetical protein